MNSKGTVVLPVIAGEPSSPANGQMWYNTVLAKLRGREGGVSVDLVQLAPSFMSQQKWAAD